MLPLCLPAEVTHHLLPLPLNGLGQSVHIGVEPLPGDVQVRCDGSRPVGLLHHSLSLVLQRPQRLLGLLPVGPSLRCADDKRDAQNSDEGYQGQSVGTHGHSRWVKVC